MRQMSSRYRKRSSYSDVCLTEQFQRRHLCSSLSREPLFSKLDDINDEEMKLNLPYHEAACNISENSEKCYKNQVNFDKKRKMFKYKKNDRHADKDEQLENKKSQGIVDRGNLKCFDQDFTNKTNEIKDLQSSTMVSRSNGAAFSVNDCGTDKFENACNDLNDIELQKYIEKKIQTKTVRSVGRTGGVYIPPFKLHELQKKLTDTSSVEYQRQSWEALKKSINGLVNKVNSGNIIVLVQDLFRENLVRGRGLLVRSIIRAQMASPSFTNVYAALVAIINSKLPEVGDLLLRRLLLQFRRAYRRNDKIVSKACIKFIALLVNQKVVHELLALQLAMLLLEKLTDDSVEICVEFIQDVGQVLQDISPKAFRVIHDRLRAVAQEGNVDRRVQYRIEDLQKIIATRFSGFPSIEPELDLVVEEDKITHEIDLLDCDIKGDEMLNIFTPQPTEVYMRSETSWQEMSKEILGIDEASYTKTASTLDSYSDSDSVEANENDTSQTIQDMSGKDIISLRKTIYLTIMSSANYEECLHKLLKLNIKEGHEIHVCTMLIDCNAMERTFQRFFALQAQRLCFLKPVYQNCFLGCFEWQYSMIHHFETNKIRSTAKFFAHLLYPNALPWSCLELLVLTEESTTSASRIFIKVIFQELAEQLGLQGLHQRLCDPSISLHLQGIFPTDNTKNMRFSINFFTAIGLGGLTTALREQLAKIQSMSNKLRNTGKAQLSSDESSLCNSSESSENDVNIN